MGDLSKHFSRREFACSSGCGFDTVDVELLQICETVRNFVGKPVRVASGARCQEHNAAVGGADNSQHLYGRAADLVVDDGDNDAVYAHLCDTFPTRYGFGKYRDHIHVDSRSSKARWSK